MSIASDFCRRQILYWMEEKKGRNKIQSYSSVQ